MSGGRVLVIGSGAGGAVTALHLARAGFEVFVLEEGGAHALGDYGKPPPEAMARLYRRRGMTPILGSVPIGYVEGRCVGGSTEINSGFWHRAPREILLRWQAQYGVQDLAEESLDEHYAWGEEMLGVTLSKQPWPRSTQLMARGIETMGWTYREIPRVAPGCRNTNTCASGCPTGAKLGMSRSLIPLAVQAGAVVVPDCRAWMLLRDGARVTGVLARLREPDGRTHTVQLEADAVFLCAGATETPSLLRRSGIKFHVGDSLRIHPMLKVAARFREPVDQHRSVLPLLQVKEFWPEITLGGAYFSPGHLAMTLGENWPRLAGEMRDFDHMGMYYVAVRGTGRGSVRPVYVGEDSTDIRYELSPDDRSNLGKGLARLASLLLAAGAEVVHPAIQGYDSIRTPVEAMRSLDEPLPSSGLSLTTVHAFSSCPMGERSDRCAADSWGKIHHLDNLYLNDASMLPDSPGVNPQATIMAMARRNVTRFITRAAQSQ